MMNQFKSLIEINRPKHWTKNFLVFIPMIIEVGLFSSVEWLQASLTFLSFGLIASCGYIFNDLFDIKGDRLHAKKKKRPIAAGKVTPAFAKIAGGILFTLGFSLSYLLVQEIFFSLALLKRLTEAVNKVDDTSISGTGYSIRDIPVLRGFGVVSGLLALQSLTASVYLTIAFLFAWQMYLWLLCERKLLHEDPIVFSFKNIPSLLGLIILIANYQTSL